MTNTKELRFEEGIKKADEMSINLEDLNNYLKRLYDIVNNLKWQGNKAETFKNDVERIKNSWDEIYTKTLTTIPLTVKNRIENYKRYENQ